MIKVLCATLVWSGIIYGSKLVVKTLVLFFLFYFSLLFFVML